MALAGMRRPKRNLLSVSLNLSGVFEDEMYVGFTSSTGQLVESHKILAWSFSDSNFSLSEKLITTGLPSFVLPKIPFFESKSFIAGTTVGDGKEPLVETVWQLKVQGKLLDALDERLREKGEFNEEEVERVLHLGLLCAYPDPNSRPTMRQVVKILEGKTNQEGCDQSENEDMDAYLLEKMNSNDLWTNYSQSFGYSSNAAHPTFDDIRQSNSSLMSLSWSNTTVQGR
ncbi:hypothetical protein EZV62_026693 [Acer yangbiense]|uniref:Legume lectin domain-containing protein n=1 Tax=Acer yangbiense TaxID=1000413 RepID=A0A5C7GSF1_9ROSI|nr:hypothetical protein EZV62_026693 [Acer yangbiense]